MRCEFAYLHLISSHTGYLSKNKFPESQRQTLAKSPKILNFKTLTACLYSDEVKLYGILNNSTTAEVLSIDYLMSPSNFQDSKNISLCKMPKVNHTHPSTHPRTHPCTHAPTHASGSCECICI